MKKSGAGRSSARPAASAPTSKRPSPEVWVPALVALGIQIGIGLALQQQPLISHPALDDAEFRVRAIALASGNAGGGTSGLPQGSPLYPFLVSWLPGIDGETHAGLLWVQALLGALTTALAARWASQHHGRAAGWLTGGLCALDAVAALFASRFSPVAWGVPTFLLACLSAGDALERGTWPSWLRTGLLVAFGLVLLPLPFVALGVLFCKTASDAERKDGHAHSGTRGRFAGPLAIGLPPVVVIGWVLLANLTGPAPAITLTWGTGPAIHQSFDPATGGTPRYLRPPSWETAGVRRGNTWEAIGREGTDADVFRFHAVRGLQRVVENPVGTIGVAFSKVAGTLSAWPIPDALSPGFVLSRTHGALGFAAWGFALLAGAGIAGLWITRRGDQRRSGPARALRIGLLAVALACLLGPTHAGIRQLAVPLLAIAAAALVASPRRSRALLLAGAVAAISILCGFLSPASPLREPSEDLRLEANGYLERGDPAEAGRRLEQARRANPENVDVLLQLALASLRDGLVDEADDRLTRAAAIDSTHPGVLLARAQLAQGREDLETAARLLDRAVVRHPNNPRYLNELGQVLARMGLVQEAIAMFAQALRLKPDYSVAKANLEAMETYRQRLEESLYPQEMRLPAGDPLDVAIPSIYDAMTQGRWTEADSLLGWAEALRPDHLVPHWLRAAYHARRGDTPSAIRSLEICVRLAPARPTIVQTLAQLYVQAGRPGDAERLVASSLELANDDPARRDALARILETLRSDP